MQADVHYMLTIKLNLENKYFKCILQSLFDIAHLKNYFYIKRKLNLTIMFKKISCIFGTFRWFLKYMTVV